MKRTRDSWEGQSPPGAGSGSSGGEAIPPNPRPTVTKKRRGNRERLPDGEWSAVPTSLIRDDLRPFDVLISIPPLVLSQFYPDIYQGFKREKEVALESIETPPIELKFGPSSGETWDQFLVQFLPPQDPQPSSSSSSSPFSSSSSSLDLSHHLLSQSRDLSSFISEASALLGGSASPDLWERFLVVDKVLTLCDDEAFDNERTLPLRTAFRMKKEAWWVMVVSKWFEERKGGGSSGIDSYLRVAGAALIVESFMRFVWARFTLQSYFRLVEEGGKEDEEMSEYVEGEKQGNGDLVAEVNQQGKPESESLGGAAVFKKEPVINDSAMGQSDEEDPSEEDSDGDVLIEEGDEDEDEDEDEDDDEEDDDDSDGILIEEGDDDNDDEDSEDGAAFEEAHFGTGLAETQRPSGQAADGIPRAPNLFFKQLDVSESFDTVEGNSFGLFESAPVIFILFHFIYFQPLES